MSAHRLLSNQNSNNTGTDQSETINKCQFFEEYSGDRTPFDVQAESEEKEDVFAGIGVCRHQ